MSEAKEQISSSRLEAVGQHGLRGEQQVSVSVDAAQVLSQLENGIFLRYGKKIDNYQKQETTGKVKSLSL